MKRSLFYSLWPVGKYLLAAEVFYFWYEMDLASQKPGFGVLIGGMLSGLLSMPGAILLETIGFPISGSSVRSARIADAQISIAVTAGIIFMVALAMRLVTELGARKDDLANQVV